MDHKPLITINGTPVKYKTWRFPSGELGLELEERMCFMDSPTVLQWYAEIATSEDLFILELIRSATCIIDPYAVQSLYLPYIPHGRQDRHTTPTTPFSLEMICNRLNLMEFDFIRLATPHSNVPSLLLNATVVPEDVEDWVLEQVHKILPPCSILPRDLLFVAPDAGAEKRVYAIAKHCGVSNVMTCLKRRDPATGNILGLQIPKDFAYYGKHVVVIDDICDGGATFIHLADALRKAGIVSDNPMNDKSLSLLVTHGIFSNGAREKLTAAGYTNVKAHYTFIEDRLKNDVTNS